VSTASLASILRGELAEAGDFADKVFESTNAGSWVRRLAVQVFNSVMALLVNLLDDQAHEQPTTMDGAGPRSSSGRAVLGTVTAHTAYGRVSALPRASLASTPRALAVSARLLARCLTLALRRNSSPRSAAHSLLAVRRSAAPCCRMGKAARRLRRSPAPLGVSTDARAPMTAPLAGSLMVALTEFQASWL
jgi:hypothetical protein